MCLGHESSGIVARLGANSAAKAFEADKVASALSAAHGEANAEAMVARRAFKVGDRVTLEPGTSCRMCTDCACGQYQVRRSFLFLSDLIRL